MFTLRFLSRTFLALAFLPACLLAQSKNGYQRIAMATERIVRDRLDVHVFQGMKPLQPRAQRS